MMLVSTKSQYELKYVVKDNQVHQIENNLTLSTWSSNYATTLSGVIQYFVVANIRGLFITMDEWEK